MASSETHCFLGHVVSRTERRVRGRTIRRLVARLRAAAREGAPEEELRRLGAAVESVLRSAVW